MKFEEVLPALREGKKVRVTNFDPMQYIYAAEMDGQLDLFLNTLAWEAPLSVVSINLLREDFSILPDDIFK